MAIGTTLTEEALKKAMDSLAEFQQQAPSFKTAPQQRAYGDRLSYPWAGFDLGDPRGDLTVRHTLSFSGPLFFESLHMVEVEPLEDWSQVRSWPRAKRRRKQGHRQNIKLYYPPRKDMVSPDGGKTFYVHPETMRTMEAQMKLMAQRMEADMDRALLASTYGITS